MNSPNDASFPYRICLTGGWLDQPWLSSIVAGSVTVVNVEANRDFMFRGGMATSTRETAKKIWKTFPNNDPVETARILFGAENPPGIEYVSGSQDALGICLPGFSVLEYHGNYWPEDIHSITDPETLQWLESVIWLVPLRQRDNGYDPLSIKNFNDFDVSQLARSSELAAEAVKTRNAKLLGKALRLTLESWKKILPLTVPDEFQPEFEAHDQFYGYNLSGCGGGYLIVIADRPVDGGFQVRIRQTA